MDIFEITNKLNVLAEEGGYDIARLQEFRKRNKERVTERVHTYKIFSRSSIPRAKHQYAFHDGGRTEVQFNIGQDWLNGRETFRYCLGFSLEKGKSLLTPMETIVPKIKKYDRYVGKNPDFVKGLNMWCHPEGAEPIPDIHAHEIPSNWVRVGNFIAIGKRFNKTIDEVNENDLEEILKLFDRLFPAYLFIENDITDYRVEKISRICWNTNGWTRPSGPEGKSKYKESYEYQNGFGHEEWLLDYDKLIGGYHYAFSQAVNTKKNKHSGKIYNLTFCSNNSKERQWYWVGEIKNVEVLDEKMAAECVRVYKQRGWLKSMIKDLKSVGVQKHNLLTAKSIHLFNIRFRPENVLWYDENPIPFERQEKSSTRYVLKDRKTRPKFKERIRSGLRFNDNPIGNTIKKIEKKISEKIIELPGTHSEIQRKLIRYLKRQYPEQRIHHEAVTGINTQIDVVREIENEKYVFYEIKTFPIVRVSIRYALGQLFEYAFFPDQNLAEEIVIVSNLPGDTDIKSYIKHLNDICEIPISYIQFDCHSGKVVQEI